MGTENTHAHGVNASINVPSIADQAVIINKLGRPNANKPLDVGAVVGGMEANGVRWSISCPPFLISRFTCYRFSEHPSSTAQYSQGRMRRGIPGRHNLSVTHFDPFSPALPQIVHIVQDMYLTAQIAPTKWRTFLLSIPKFDTPVHPPASIIGKLPLNALGCPDRAMVKILVTDVYLINHG